MLTQTLWCLIFNETICSPRFCVHCIFKLLKDVSDVPDSPGISHQPGSSVGFNCFQQECTVISLWYWTECCLMCCNHCSRLSHCGTQAHTRHSAHVQNCINCIDTLGCSYSCKYYKMRGKCCDPCQSRCLGMWLHKKKFSLFLKMAHILMNFCMYAVLRTDIHSVTVVLCVDVLQCYRPHETHYICCWSFLSPGEAGQEYPLPHQQRGPGQDSDYWAWSAHQSDRGERADSRCCSTAAPASFFSLQSML